MLAIVLHRSEASQYSELDLHTEMLRFDGEQLQAVDNTNAYQGKGFVFQNELYFGIGEERTKLVRFNGFQLEVVSEDYQGFAGELANTSYLYFEDVHGQNSLYQFNGTQLRLIHTPQNYQLANELAITHNQQLFLSFKDVQNNTVMGIFDGSNLKLLSNPSSYQGSYSGYQNEAVVFQNKLYFRMSNEHFSSQLALLADAQQDQIQNAHMTSMKVYPNPIRNDQITLKVTNEVEGIAIIQVFNENGQLMARQSAVKFGPQLEETVSLENMPNGVYSVQLVQPEAGIQSVQQVVKIGD